MRRSVVRLLARWLGDDWGPASPLRFAVSYLRRHKGAASVILTLSLLEALFEGGSLTLVMFGVHILATGSVNEGVTGLGQIGSRFIGPFLDSYTPIRAFVTLVLAGILTQVLRSACSYGAAVAAVHLKNRVSCDATMQGYERVLALDYPSIVSQRGGEVSYKAAMMPTMSSVIQLLVQLVRAFAMIGAYTLLLVVLAPVLSLAVVAGAILISVVMRRTHRTIQKLSERHARIQQDLQHFGLELFQSFRLVHAHATWDLTLERIRGFIGPAYATRRHVEMISAAIGPLFEILLITGTGALLVGLVYFSGDDAPAVLSGMLVAILAMYRAMPWANAFNLVRVGLASNLPMLKLSVALFSDTSLKLRPRGLQPLRERPTSVTFDRVSFTYPGSPAPAVSNVSFELCAGKCLAMVGASGSGKSTLTDLFIGLREPTDGRILIDGCDLSKLDAESWRATLGVVSQDTFLYNASVRDNIAYGFDVIDDDRIKMAASLAHVEEFVAELPDGYATVIGDRGHRLSGGQRQRLALARALYRRPQVLILDEATSALDSESERVVQEAIQSTIGTGVTTLIVAHRLSTVAHADEILVLDRGQVVERGTHASLIRAAGIYARLLAIQAMSDQPIEA